MTDGQCVKVEWQDGERERMRLSETENVWSADEYVKSAERASAEGCTLGGSLHRERCWRHGWKVNQAGAMLALCWAAHAETVAYRPSKVLSGRPISSASIPVASPTAAPTSPSARPDRTFACGSGAMQVRHESTITCLHPRTLPPGLLWRRNRTERRFNKLSRAMFAAATPAVRRERACGRRRRRRR